jgi:hypothetical protein
MGSFSLLICLPFGGGFMIPLARYASLRERLPPTFARTALTSAIWSRLQTWDDEDPAPHALCYPTISEWWDDIIQEKLKKEQRRISGRLLYAIWNAWKERNRRIITAKRLTYVEVASISREDILQRDHAFTAYAPAIPAEPD